VAAHVNDEVDVLLIVLEGAGHATIDARSFELRAGVVVAIPKSTTREIRAADDAELVYVTVHRARPGVRIRA
jgi:mannose-6-phosphate isomerase-like protein (cupin superfamily)